MWYSVSPTRQNSGRDIPHLVRLKVEAKPVREGRNRRGGGGENRPHSTGNQPTQPINQPGCDDGSAANSVSDFLQ
jgi:hypothetical protein